MKGFSPRNLRYMRRFSELWPEPEVWQRLLPNLPWFHLCTIMDKAAEHRDWYARAAVEYGWSRPILVMQIETGAHERFGKATTNFERTLPKPLSDLARETPKDPRSSVERILRHGACANAGGEIFRLREEAACAEGGEEGERAMSAAEGCRETSASPKIVQGVLAHIRQRTVGDLLRTTIA
jgi:predicted nuclease of restriction endonuclease-like (RecB) superfamily